MTIPDLQPTTDLADLISVTRSELTQVSDSALISLQRVTGLPSSRSVARGSWYDMINGLAPYNLALAQMSEVWFNVVGNRAADRVQSAKDYEWMPPKEELDLYKRLSPSYVQWGRSDEGDVMVRWPYDLVPVTWWLGCEWQITDGVGGWVINRAGGTSYNTTDASIWACARLSLIWAVRYRSAVNKIKFVMELDKWAARNRV